MVLAYCLRGWQRASDASWYRRQTNTDRLKSVNFPPRPVKNSHRDRRVPQHQRAHVHQVVARQVGPVAALDAGPVLVVDVGGCKFCCVENRSAFACGAAASARQTHGYLLAPVPDLQPTANRIHLKYPSSAMSSSMRSRDEPGALTKGAMRARMSTILPGTHLGWIGGGLCHGLGFRWIGSDFSTPA